MSGTVGPQPPPPPRPPAGQGPPPGYGPPVGQPPPPGYGPPPGRGGPPPGGAPPGQGGPPPGFGPPPGQGGAPRHGEPPLPSGIARPSQLPALKPVAFSGVLRSEWTKVRSIRSTTITLLVTAVLVVGIGSLICLAAANSSSASVSDPTALSLVMLVFAQLVIGIFGVMAVTSEYASGTIRPSLMAVPRRQTFFLSKVVVVGGICLVVGEVVAFAAFGVGQAILHGRTVPAFDPATVSASLGQPGVLRAVVGAGLYLTLLGLIGLALGLLVRVTAGGIAIVVGLVFIAPIILAFIPGTLGNDLQKYWPTSAGQQIYRVESASSVMAPWTGFAVLVALTVVLLGGSLMVLRRRDA